MRARGTAGEAGRRSRRQDVCRVGLLFLATLLLAGLAIPPAHADGPPGHPHHESSGVTVGVLLLVTAGIAVAGSRRRGRRVAILALAFLVGLFAVESAVHSVHHFWDPQSAASCPLFVASLHAEGVEASSAITGITTWTVQSSLTIADPPIRSLQHFRSHEGRAPPVPPSA